MEKKNVDEKSDTDHEHRLGRQNGDNFILDKASAILGMSAN